jgi:hypothetical protein
MKPAAMAIPKGGFFKDKQEFCRPASVGVLSFEHNSREEPSSACGTMSGRNGHAGNDPHRGRQAARAAGADMNRAVQHGTEGLGIWEWASNDKGYQPDMVMACRGDIGAGRAHPQVLARTENPGAS